MRDLARIARQQATVVSLEEAVALLRTISLAIKNLAFTPLASPIRDEVGARERQVAGHRIVYDVEAGTNLGPSAGDITVLHIAAADMIDEFRREPA